MRKTGRCILSAVIAVLLMIGAIDYAFVIGKAKPVGDLKTSQSEVIVKDLSTITMRLAKEIRGLIMDFIQSNTRNQQERAVLTRL